MVSAENLACAIKAAATMNRTEKEQVCDVIYATQPNLLASVLTLASLGASLETVDVLLNILIVTHLAVEKSGQVLATVSEEEQSRHLRHYVATVKFAEGLDPASFAKSVQQTTAYKKEKFLFAYCLDTMKSAAFFDEQAESAKYPMMAGINLVNCIANAKRIT